MDEQQFMEYLVHFGLTRQEALIYQKLLQNGKQTGYEIAKETGISRSNAYNALAALVEKGAAYLLEESAKRYIPVNLEEFCENCIRRMKAEEEWMLQNLPSEQIVEEGYITIEGEVNMQDKIQNLLESAGQRIYISCSLKNLTIFSPFLYQAVSKGKKVVIITDGSFQLEGAKTYTTESKGKQIGIITDSKYILSGEFGKGSMNTCLYSGQNNIVLVFKTALANEIQLIELREGEQKK